LHLAAEGNKPACPLEKNRAACHLRAMPERENTTDKPTGRKEKPLTKEERLAKALRENLRRRKGKPS
jgi:hypothetical protein